MPDGTLRDGALISHTSSLYTPDQISQYLDRISFFDKPVGTTAFSPTLENLTRLARSQLLAIPFENTDMHYTADHQMDVTPEGAFKRIVFDRKGSYCFGHSTVLLEVLRGLGYRVQTACGRVNETSDVHALPRLGPPLHVVLLVQPFPLDSTRNNETYIVDSWFGRQSLTSPLLLSDREDNIITGASPYEKHRLSRKPLPRSSFYSLADSEPVEDYWCLEYRKEMPNDDSSKPWQLLYTLTEDEFLPDDIARGSSMICNGQRNTFTNNIIAVRHLSFDQLDKDGLADALEEFKEYSEEEQKTFLWKYIMSGREVKRNVGCSTVRIRTQKIIPDISWEGDLLWVLPSFCPQLCRVSCEQCRR